MNQAVAATAAPTAPAAGTRRGSGIRAARLRVASRPRLKATPNSPASTPSSTKNGSASTGGCAMAAVRNTGLWPKSSRLTASAVTHARKVAEKTPGAKFFWISSSTKITPASGALNAAASPLPAPAATITWRSWDEDGNQRDTTRPSAPPI